MAVNTAILKRIDQRLAVIERYVVHLAAESGVEIPDDVIGRNLPKAPSRSELKFGGAPSVPDEIDATPSAEELAQEAGVDLSSVEGTGAGGRITKGDVEKALQAT